MSGFTLGHFLYAIAALDVVVVPLMARSVIRANPGAPPTGAYMIVGAAIASALVLCGIATFSDVGRIPIL